MKTKEEVIQIAYDGEKYDWDENGWLTYGVDENSEFGYEPFGEYETRNHVDGIYEWRPLSLKGIESNNGWISINSEKDLPKEYGYYHLRLESGDEIIAYNSLHRRLFSDCDNDIEYRFVTHYQPTEKLNSPLHK